MLNLRASMVDLAYVLGLIKMNFEDTSTLLNKDAKYGSSAQYRNRTPASSVFFGAWIHSKNLKLRLGSHYTILGLIFQSETDLNGKQITIHSVSVHLLSCDV